MSLRIPTSGYRRNVGIHTSLTPTYKTVGAGSPHPGTRKGSPYGKSVLAGLNIVVRHLHLMQNLGYSRQGNFPPAILHRLVYFFDNKQVAHTHFSGHKNFGIERHIFRKCIHL